MPLRIAIPDMISPSYFPAIAAVELGLLREQGLDATIELLGPVTATYEALRDGAIDYAGGAAHAPLYAFPEWAGCQLLCALSQNMYWFVVLRADIDAARGDLSALKGLRIGAAPGPVDGLIRMLRDAGLDPGRDVRIGRVPGATGDRASFGVMAAEALARGELDGFWANGMGCEVAVRGGIGSLLLDARRGDGPPGSVDYTFPAMVATRQRVEERPQEVKALVRGIVAAQLALKKDPALATRAAARLFPPREAALIAELVRRDSPFYDAALSRPKIDALNAFSKDLGLLSQAPAYDDLVPPPVREVW
jgi:ABC-type nitrate/sulfonate/bicarbonate transport system substrate-binding protein